MVILCGQRRKKEDILKKVQRICFHFQSCRYGFCSDSIFGKGNDDGLVMSHQSAWARLCEDYLERHNVSDLIKRALVRLCIAQPDDPVAFLSHYFQLLEKGEDLSLHASLVRRTILLKNGFPEGEPLRKWFRHVSRSDALFEKRVSINCEPH
ncbi:cAMP-dependent protein kinase type I-alpha regulatory subunit [Trichinella pseudospiralis]|uniref:cAMP-dependent protein kinase type I-alpha regulatory subunit n=1 Tax=Trichinella pseudospiralis TaxID=6337 RepID=A0A0V1F1G2_TRIPS|nr:cAMP-dependent protein kinase type I-alpha regulatory subunit [Trichinella pseudospiralis]